MNKYDYVQRLEETRAKRNKLVEEANEYITMLNDAIENAKILNRCNILIDKEILYFDEYAMHNNLEDLQYILDKLLETFEDVEDASTYK